MGSLFLLRGDKLKIREILKNTQPGAYKKLKKSYEGENLSHNDFENLMKHSSYKRGAGGAIRQVR